MNSNHYLESLCSSTPHENGDFSECYAVIHPGDIYVAIIDLSAEQKSYKFGETTIPPTFINYD